MYRLVVVLAVAAMLVLAGCGQERPAAPATAPSARTVPPSTLGSGTTLVSSLPRLLRIVDGYHMFEVSPQQYQTIGRRVHEVIVRQHLSDQGVRFGANVDPDRHLYFVLIDPGLSGLTARQILDRLLGA